MCGVLRSTGIRRRRFSQVGSTEEEKHAYNASTLGEPLPAGGVDPTVVGVLRVANPFCATRFVQPSRRRCRIFLQVR